MCRLWSAGVTMEFVCICVLTLLGSYLQFTKADRCDVCRRSSRACQVVRGEFTKSKLPRGYNHIRQIPAGVCNINITELGPSSNYIALKTVSGGDIINSQWTIKSPGVYHKTGTIFKYGRTRDRNCPGECVLALGPTNESIEFQLLTYHTNPGFVYEYQLPGTRWSAPKKHNGRHRQRNHRRKHHRRHPHKTRHETVTSRQGSVSKAQTYGTVLKSQGRTHSIPYDRTASRNVHTDYKPQNRSIPHIFSSVHGESTQHSGRTSGFAGFQEAKTVYKAFPRPTSSPSRPNRRTVHRHQPKSSHRLNTHRRGEHTPRYISRRYQALTLSETTDTGQGRHPKGDEHWRRPSGEYRPSQTAIPPRRYLPNPGESTASNQVGIQGSYIPYQENLHVGSRYSTSESPPGIADWERRRVYQPPVKASQHVSSEYPQLRVREGPKYVSPYGEDLPYGKVQPLTNQEREHQQVILPQESSSFLTSNQALPVDGVPEESRGGQNQPFLPDSNRHVISPDLTGTDYNQGEARTIRYSWRIQGFTNCSRECGGGVQDTVIICVKGNSEALVTEDNCDTRIKPEPQQVECNLRPCPPEWETGEWSECSATCGQGLQRRRVECKKRISPVLQISVSAKRCSSSAKPSIVQQCQSAACARWQAEDWGQCSVKCGTGERHRRVSCVDGNNRPVPEVHCKGPRPSTQETCHRGSCSRHWYYTEWTDTCSTDCGVGVISRQVVCLSKDGNVLKSKRCERYNKPESQKSCDASRACGGEWFVGPWKKCSTLCGKGVTTREIICMKNENSDISRPVSDSECDAKDKPLREKPCEGVECGVQWYMTDWSACSVTCGSGYQTREVRCLDTEMEVSSQCEVRERPEAKKSCSLSECQTDSETRDPDCRDKLPNCVVVAQARLCRYKFYKSVCCETCAKSHH